MFRQMVHDLNLAPNIVVIFLAEEFAFWDRFAGVKGSCGFMGAEVGGAELALAELLANEVVITESWGLVGEN